MPRSWNVRVFWLLLGAAIFVSFAYDLPYLISLSQTGSEAIPAIMDGDATLYLNLSNIQYSGPNSQIINPWYGSITPTNEVVHLRFPLPFFLFHGLRSITSNLVVAVLIWNALWAGLTFYAGYFLVGNLFPNIAVEEKLVGGLILALLRSPLAPWYSIMSIQARFNGFELLMAGPLVGLAFGFVLKSLLDKAEQGWNLQPRVVAPLLSAIVLMMLLPLCGFARKIWQPPVPTGLLEYSRDIQNATPPTAVVLSPEGG